MILVSRVSGPNHVHLPPAVRAVSIAFSAVLLFAPFSSRLSTPIRLCCARTFAKVRVTTSTPNRRAGPGPCQRRAAIRHELAQFVERIFKQNIQESQRRAGNPSWPRTCHVLGALPGAANYIFFNAARSGLCLRRDLSSGGPLCPECSSLIPTSYCLSVQMSPYCK